MLKNALTRAERQRLYKGNIPTQKSFPLMGNMMDIA